MDDAFFSQPGLYIPKAHDFLSVPLPDESRNAPGMVSIPERQMLYYHCSTTYTGQGAIIDGGSFFGSSIVASATGVKANPAFREMDFSNLPHGKPIHGYELGFLPAPKSDKIDPHRMYGGVPYKLGDNFVPILEATIANHTDVISMNIGDLTQQVWPDAPIEIAFIDVCKTIKLNAHVSKQFFPNLIGAGSYMINQDFFFDRLPWIKVTMGYLEDYFVWEGQVATSSMYRNIKAVPLDVASYDPFQEATLDECIALHKRTPEAHLDRPYRLYMELSIAYLCALKHDRDQALDRLDTIEQDYEDVLQDQDNDRGNRFRFDRAKRQITNGMIFRVS